MIQLNTKYAHANTAVVLLYQAIHGKSADAQKKARKGMRKLSNELVDIRETLSDRIKEVAMAKKAAGEDEKKLKAAKKLEAEVQAEVDQANKEDITVELVKDVLEAIKAVYDGFDWDNADLKGKFSTFDMFNIDDFVEDIESALVEKPAPSK